ncbi:MAG: ribonuclease HI [Thermodesulfovibrionales bacterium]|nr:ribonuclease HI [Thermodesulfovibrionales bacterium]
MDEVLIYADGACSGNPGQGGFGSILKIGNKEIEFTGYEEKTTNNRMELMAVIIPLEYIKKPSRVKVITDSNYVVKGMSEWIINWQKNNWKTSQGKAVLNQDLWKRLLNASKPHSIKWIWIKGHNGHIENERCDRLALEEIKKHKRRL